MRSPRLAPVALMALAGAALSACQPGQGELGTISPGGDERAEIAEVVHGVVEALNQRDGEALFRYYAVESEQQYFGIQPAPVVKGGRQYVTALNQCLATFESVRVDPNDDMQIRRSGSLAIANLTGTNTVGYADGTTDTSPWRWSVALERQDDGRWLITHDHLSFFAGS